MTTGGDGNVALIETGSTSIAMIVNRCLQELSQAKRDCTDSDLLSTIEDLEGGFRVWCGNLAAYQNGTKASPDH